MRTFTSRSHYPSHRGAKRGRREVETLVAAALEKLSVNQAAQTWSRRLKAPAVFKADTRDYIRSIDPAMASSKDIVEKITNSGYTLDDMTDATKSMSVRLCNWSHTFDRGSLGCAHGIFLACARVSICSPVRARYMALWMQIQKEIIM